MKISKILDLAMDFISFHKLGASLAIVAIILSVLVQSFTFSTLQSVESGWVRTVMSSGHNWVAVYPRLSGGLVPSETLTEEDLYELEGIEGITYVAPLLQSQMSIEMEVDGKITTRNVTLIGTNNNIVHVFDYKLRNGTFWESASLSEGGEIPAVLGADVWRSSDIESGSTIIGRIKKGKGGYTSLDGYDEIELEITGLLGSKWRYEVPFLGISLLELNNVVLSPYELVKDYGGIEIPFDEPKLPGIMGFIMKVLYNYLFRDITATLPLLGLVYMCSISEGTTIAEVRENIEKNAVLAGRITIFSQEDFRAAGEMGMESLSVVQNVAMVIMSLIAGISIFVVMMISVSDRTREIGALKAIGAKDIDVMAIFLSQALLFAIAGCTLGGVLSFSLLYGAKNVIGNYFAFTDLGQLIIPMSLFVMISFLITLVSTIYPSYRAASLDPIEALRQE